jgi:sugar-specific transcriptional regulator TrmB
MLEPLRQEIETLPIETQERLLAIVHDLKKEQESTLSKTFPLESLRQQAIENGYDTKEKILDLIQQVKHEIIVEKGWLKE